MIFILTKLYKNDTFQKDFTINGDSVTFYFHSNENNNIIKDKAYGIAWLNMVVSLLIMCLFYEQGDRLTHGNFFWSAYFFAGLLFIVSISKFNQLIREKRVFPLVLSSMALGIHFFCWLNYFMYVLFSRYK